jgi:hypothetical protein
MHRKTGQSHCQTTVICVKVANGSFAELRVRRRPRSGRRLDSGIIFSTANNRHSGYGKRRPCQLRRGDLLGVEQRMRVERTGGMTW